MKSDVFFVKCESRDAEKRLAALKKILAETNPFTSFKKEEIIPVKMTMGEPACAYNVTPELVRAVIADIKKHGAKPFLFDTCVIYKGQRQNAVDHLDLAQNKGFGYSKIGAPFVIADGLLGYDGTEHKIDSSYIKKIKIPSFIGLLDSLVVLSHATGHIVSGYGGAIKNVAMGMSCRPTKQIQHSALKPSVIGKSCTACGKCISICPVNSITFKKCKAFIDQEICVGCGECLCACRFNAILINWREDPLIFCKRMAEVCDHILKRFKNKFFITFAFDITKDCDCISTKKDTMISADLGILASKDPLALDKATTDLGLKNKNGDFLDKTKRIYEDMYLYASKIGMGNPEYNLVEL